MLPVQLAIFKNVQTVSLQVEKAQSRQAAQRLDVQASDVVVTKVQFLQVATVFQ